MRSLDTEYLVVGAGAMGMALTDAADRPRRRARDAGGPASLRRRSLNDAYPFVQLHQASVFYGVASTVLGDGSLQQTGPETGLQERARQPQVQAYFDDVLHRRFIGSGRVTFLPGVDYHCDGGSHLVTSLVSRSTPRSVTPGNASTSGCSRPSSGSRWSARAVARRVSTTRSPNAMAPASAPRSWAAASSACRPARGLTSAPPTSGVVGGRNPLFHTPVFVLTALPTPIDRDGGRHGVPLRRCHAPQPRRRSTSRGEAAGGLDVRVAEAPRLSATSWRRTSSTRFTSCRCRSCSAAAFGCGTASRASRTATTSRRSRHRAVSHTSRSRVDDAHGRRQTGWIVRSRQRRP